MPSRLAVISFLDEPGSPVYPGNALPGAPAYPSHGLPGAGRPDQSLPGGGHIWLPVYGFDPTRPDAGLPPAPGRPGNELPGDQPGMDNSLPRPGKRYVVKWLACTGLILVPDHALPETPEPK